MRLRMDHVNDLSKKVVLVVDDNATIRKIYHDALVTSGYEVYSAESGSRALELLHSIPQPCAIILDCFMPIMNGPQFIDSLRETLPEVANGTHILGVSSLPRDNAGVREFAEKVSV